MSINAGELADKVVEKKLKEGQHEYNYFKRVCSGAIEQMLEESLESKVVPVDIKDSVVLEKVTEELREDGYKFAYIEVENTDGEIIKRKLRISVAHLCKG